ncbi:MAG: phosphoribosylformylglycinamidine synthase subunit PurQ [Azospirillaceae bacterium]
MRAVVIVFPGSNCDRDVAVALRAATGRDPLMVWHRETDLPEADLIVLPGGFSYGDYLRAGAMAAHSPILRDVAARAKAGVPVLGICNGFQILAETGLLPGALVRNADLRFVARTVTLTVERADTPYTAGYRAGEEIRIPVAHHDGNYTADADTLARLEGEGRVVLRYGEPVNGSAADIAGLADPTGRIMGLMPHPERASDPALGPADGQRFFTGLAAALA